MNDQRKISLFIILILALMGGLFVSFKTKAGIGISSDSINYLHLARDFSKDFSSTINESGDERHWIKHSPPFYPIVLSLGSYWGVDPETEARWLNVFFFGFNVLLAGLIVQRFTRSAVLSILASLLMFSRDILSISLSLMTESMFISLILLGLLFLALYLEKQKRWLLLASAVFLALAAITKIGGVPVIITGIFGLVILSPASKRLGAKYISVIIFAAIALTPFLIWMIRNYYLAGFIIDRTVVMHLTGKGQFLFLLKVVSLWFFSNPLFFGLFLTVFIAALAFNARYQKAYPAFAALSGLGLIFYMLSVIIVNSFFDASMHLNERILVPAHVLAILYVCTVLSSFNQRGKSLILNILGIVVIGFCMGSLMMGIQNIKIMDLTYTSNAWKNSKLLQEVRKLPTGIQIFSNDPKIIDYYVQKKVKNLPNKYDRYSLLPNGDYVIKMDHIKERLKGKGAVFIYFKNHTPSYLPTINEIKQLLPLKLLNQYDDGMIYQIGQ